MDTAVNVQILEQCIASGNLGREIYDRLDSKERSFIANYEQRSQAIEDLIKQLDGHITEEHINTRGRITEEHIATRESVTNKIGMMETNNRQELGCKRLLNSLNYPRMNERKNAIPERHDGTFEWVFEGFESEKYSTSDSKSHNDSNFRTTPEAKRDQAIADLLRWLRGDGFGMFWISGKPGSGKSTFVKFIMSDERTRLSLNKWRSRTEIITYFFWKPGTLLQQNFQGLLCSLLHQVLSIDVDVCAQLLRKSSGLRHKHVDTDWALEELKRHLFMALRSSNRSYLILLDGLDEMAKPHRGPRELFDFLDTLMKERRVKLCLSSRPERIFLDRFSSCLHLRMHDVNFEDIRNFTAEFFDDLDLEPHDPKQFSILREILGKADGVFIWVHLVLQNVRNGVQELGEGWDEIYQRVLELPSDLMRLYKDMWSRLDQRKEHYVEMADLYFNTVRWANGGFTLACLAVATDNAILESFTERNQVPTLIDLVKRCDYVHRTLFPISAGLLETQTSIASSFAHLCTLSNHDDPESLSTMEKWDTEYVRFTHRTAIDFLDSAEGHKLFGKYATSHETIHSRIINAAIIFGCVPYRRDLRLRGTKRILGYLEPPRRRSQFSDRVYDLFCRVHKHAHMIDDFSIPAPSFSSHNYFILVASWYGYYEYVTQVLGLEGDHCAKATAAALVGASDGIFFPLVMEELEPQRCQFIRKCINYLRPGRAMSTVSHWDDSSHFLLAWRCFLLRKLSDALSGSLQREEDTLAVIESFISAGVLQRQPPPRYLIRVENRHTLSIPSQREIAQLGFMSIHMELLQGSNLFFEIDDTFILQHLCNRMSNTSESIICVLQAVERAMVRPVLAWQGKWWGRQPGAFTCTLKNHEDEKEFVDWALKSFAEGTKLPEDAPDFFRIGTSR
ncbi:hypothetical protein CGCF245_v006909 [Colletotrichum fructicola]|nr:hypothetical protein CGCF245_v006909 [Colletotrichum fructicola]